MKTIFLYTILLFVSAYCYSQNNNDSLYILYEKENEYIKKIDENNDCYYIYIMSKRDPSFVFGFKPVETGEIVDSKSIPTINKIKDIAWMREKCKFSYKPVSSVKNIFIVEQISDNSLLITKVKFFTQIE